MQSIFQKKGIASMPTLKYSRQREAVKEFLASRIDHPTADTVYTNLREKFPNISLGTVYRNLSLLADMGEIIKITTGDGADRFDGRITPHNHFICHKCHKVSDLEIWVLPKKTFWEKLTAMSRIFMGFVGIVLKNHKFPKIS